MLYGFGRIVFWVFFHAYLKFTVRGVRNIPRSGAFIIASNHRSYLDPPAVGVACPRNLNYLARETLFKNKFFRWGLPRVGCIPLKRHAAHFGALKEALKRLQKGQGLLLFPEGTRRISGEVGRGFEGVGFLARKSGAPVIPAYVKGTDKALPKGVQRVRRAGVEVVFDEPVSYPEDASDAQITQEIMKRIAHLRESEGQD